jgi:hypothetical protein
VKQKDFDNIKMHGTTMKEKEKVLLCLWSLSVSTRDGEGPGDCVQKVFIAEEDEWVVGGGGGRGYHNSRCRDRLGGLFGGLLDEGLFSSFSEVSRSLPHQLLY